MDSRVAAAAVLLITVVASVALLAASQPAKGFSALRLDGGENFSGTVENHWPVPMNYSLAIYRNESVVGAMTFALAADANRTLDFGITGPASAVLTDADGNAYAVSRR